jgi:8-oxo-dGTP pyrophosphatase MutT (NUDIX family)
VGNGGSATARPAATVVVAREPMGGGPGVEVLALRRAAGSRFAPGFVVFPGGTQAPEDESLAQRWFGSAGEALRACAVRELAEETGLVFTAGGLREAPGRLPGDPDLPPPGVGQLTELARWVAPDFLPVRFDARFFAVTAEPGLAAVPDGVEIERAWWARPEDVLDEAARGDGALMWPTLTFLRALSGCASPAEVLALRVPQVEPGPEARFPATRAPRP